MKPVIGAIAVVIFALAACASPTSSTPGRQTAGDPVGPGGGGMAAPPMLSAAGSAGQATAAGFGGQATVGPMAGQAPLPAAGTMATQALQPPVNLDPNMKFVWEETAPGKAGSADGCRAGLYTGTFQCLFIPDAGTVGSSTQQATGPISLKLVQSVDGEFLQIADGDFSATAKLFVGFKAKLRGELDCKTLQISATTEGGMWAFGDPDMPFLPGGPFGAELQGSLDPPTGVLAGQFSFTTGTFPGTCTGDWSTIYTP